jgi:hypothetical protein
MRSIGRSANRLFRPGSVFTGRKFTNRFNRFRQILSGDALGPDAGVDAIPLHLGSGCFDGANGGVRDLRSNAIAGNQSNAMSHIS